MIDRRFGSGQDIALSKTVQVDVSKAVTFAPSGDLEWVDPFVGFRVRHEMGPSKELGLEADFGGFGVSSDFSWQVVGTYGFDTTCLGTPCGDRLSRAVSGFQREWQIRKERHRHGATRANHGCDLPLVTR